MAHAHVVHHYMGTARDQTDIVCLDGIRVLWVLILNTFHKAIETLGHGATEHLSVE